MGKSVGVCNGIGGSQHLCSDRFFSNGSQGGIVPVCAGLAYSQKIKPNQGIGVVSIGDGTLGEGIIYETMNLVSKWNIPLLTVLENNRYAQSTSQMDTLAGSIDDRFSSFDIKTYSGNTWEFEELFDSMSKCIDYVRKTQNWSLLIRIFEKMSTHKII